MKRRPLTFIPLLIAVLLSVSFSAIAEIQYIFPESNTRLLTWDEVEAWNNDALHIGFNEIWARYGYVFNPGGACEYWFTRQPWYTPNYNGANQENAINQATRLEWDNYHLIKDVMAWKRANGTASKGKSLPEPPGDIGVLSGFQYIKLKTGQNLAVYSAPSSASWRGANGKASVSTNGRVYAFAQENGWLMVMYETNASANAVRVGWVNIGKIKGTVPIQTAADFQYSPKVTTYSAEVTDDPTGLTPITVLPAGTAVTYLRSFSSARYLWDYIEFTHQGKTARGFLRAGNLAVEETDADGWGQK